MRCAESDVPPPAGDRHPVGLHGRGRVRAVHLPGHRARPVAHVGRRRCAPFDGAPCGLAARDVLRLEMGYPLYGQDLFESSTALEAGLSWAVAFDKGDVPRARGAAPPAGRGAAEPAPRAPDARAAAHPARALPGLRRGPRDRRGDERDVLPAAADRDRAGVPVAGRRRRRRRRGEVDIRGRRGAATVVRPPFVDRSPR